MICASWLTVTLISSNKASSPGSRSGADLPGSFMSVHLYAVSYEFVAEEILFIDLQIRYSLALRFLILHLITINPIRLLQKSILTDEKVVLVDIHLNARCSAIEALQSSCTVLYSSSVQHREIRISRHTAIILTSPFL